MGDVLISFEQGLFGLRSSQIGTGLN